MPEISRFDIAVVGDSFVGLAFALAAVRTLGPDLKIAVVGDRSAGTMAATDVRASAITAGSKRLLEAVGLWSRVADDAEPVTRIELTDSSLEAGVRPVLTRYENVLDGEEAASYIAPNAVIERALREAADAVGSVTWIRGRVVDYASGEGSAEIGIAGGQRVRAALVVAADGRKSRLRELAGIGVVTLGGGQTGIVTRIAHEIPHEGVAVQHFLPGGPFAILPLRGQHSCITWSERDDEARRILALDDSAFLDEVDRRVGGRLGALTLDGGRQAWPLTTQLARAFVAPRVALVGDAAHGVHPIAGQGLNLGLRDVGALVEVLAEGARVGLDPGDSTLLARYEQWRRFDSVVAATAFEGLNRLFSNDLTLLRSVREVGLGLVDRVPGLKRLLVREAAGLTGRVPMLLKGELPG